MRTSPLIVASILAVAVSAQAPEVCIEVVTLSQKCIPDDASVDDLQTSTAIAACLCDNTGFDSKVAECLDATGSVLPEESRQFLASFQGYCDLLAGGGGGGGIPTSAPVTRSTETSASITPTPTPTGSGDDDDNVPENCRYIASGLSSCWTDNSPLPTAAPVARCLCAGTSFDAAIEGCYSDILDTDPKEAATVSAFAGFCSSFSAGAFGGSGPTGSDNNQPTNTGGSNSPSPTDDDDDDDAPSTTGPAQTTGSNSNNGGNGPSSAAGFKVTILGTALAAILAGAALVL
ncbi:hypothetical protein TWF192_007680 [Orbilia oligospora]|uniref:Extracellular membrane protein CFEM domain-containing protein n=1 Tax=Orbilia oligospora TaxID=2813651 RepID=A0A6G1M4D1_ORBOL|nr:hypothetical protein TWF679_008221 [Orbilia oligospora]KAF3220496.1 hypothetical protein TWF191_007395 [Orbilia oligospora]KAF3244748.1 hypothetical protein TWF192_007680 [Orbilia oligospora]